MVILARLVILLDVGIAVVIGVPLTIQPTCVGAVGPVIALADGVDVIYLSDGNVIPLGTTVPLIFVVYDDLPIFIVFTIGTVRSVPVPMFIPPVAVESDPIIIGPVVRVAAVEPPPKYNAPVVCEFETFTIPVAGFVALLIFVPSNPILQQ